MITVKEALREASKALQATSDAPTLDAERLLLFVLGQTETSWLYGHDDSILPNSAADHYHDLCKRRHTGEPVAYLIGTQEFYGRPFSVTPDVLVPRPATEQLVEEALTAAQNLAKRLGRPITVADIGTGSGCIAVTLALESNREVISHIYATDISPAALNVAQENAHHHNVHDRITFLPGNLLEPLSDISIDLLVSNPPYVPSKELDHAGESTETRGLLFEPRLALDGGTDGRIYVQLLQTKTSPATAGLVETIGGTITRWRIP